MGTRLSRVAKFGMVAPNILWVPSVEIASCHCPGAEVCGTFVDCWLK